ncbi:MAG: hypothetical protein ABIK97_03145 [candidate division WOR-3 bacterium]
MRRWLLGNIIFSLLLVSELRGEQDYFGKNKVQYEKTSFRVKESERFLIYYPEGEENLLSFAQFIVEDQAQFLEKNLSLKKKDKTPIIIYNSFLRFSETNIILDLIEEGIGGFAELLRRRVVVPYDGDLSLLERTLRHEVTHIYEYEVLFKRGAALIARGPNLPLFVLEGYSEYTASKFLGPDGFSSLYLRDYLVGNNFSLEDLARDKSYLSYRLGEAFYFFIESIYGERKTHQFLLNLKNKGFAEGIKATFGKSVKSLGEDFLEYLRLKYLPSYSLRAKDSLLRFLTHSRKGVFNIRPVISPKGDKVAYLSNEKGDFSLHLALTTGKVIRRLKFKPLREEIRFLKRVIAFSSSGGEEEIALFALREGRSELRIFSSNFKLKKRFLLPLAECSEPSFSPDGKSLAFIGLKDGFSDLYLFTLETGKLERLTSDWADDFSPSFSPTGETIIFVKRKIEERKIYRETEIWGYILKSQTIFRFGPSHPGIRDPFLLPSGELLFRAGDQQIYLWENGKLFRTNFFGGFSDLSLTPDGKLCFSYFKNGSWEIGIGELEEMKPVFQPVEKETAPEGKTISSIEEGERTGFTLGADYAYGALTLSEGLFSGYVYLALSDILGDHRFFILTDLSGVVDFSNFYFSYWYLKERIDYNFTLYQFLYGWETSNRAYLFRDRGIFPGISYPFSREDRLEMGLGLRNLNFWIYKVSEGEWVLQESSSYLSLPYFFAYVFDNTRYTLFGPNKGTRARLNFEISPFSKNYYTEYLDLRRYQNLFSDYTLALRLFNIGSFGKDPDSFYISGEICRGYAPYQFIDTTGTFLSGFQSEFRFPLIKEIKLGLPPLTFGNIMGRVFLDGAFLLRAGRWQKKESWFTKFGWGFGIAVYIPPLPVRVDFSYPLTGGKDKRWQFTLRLGEEF